ncbi:MAG: hypothetical protein JRE45_11690 [Deltaproteobacteria bacterium]|nr:hypothetical protein [Deltaproteobacteria bacterium]
MSSDHIAYEKRGSIGFVKFNRPDKRNAFTVEMFQRTAEVFTEADDDVDIRCIVVHAEGPDTTTGLDLMNVVPSFRAGSASSARPANGRDGMTRGESITSSGRSPGSCAGLGGGGLFAS